MSIYVRRQSGRLLAQYVRLKRYAELPDEILTANKPGLSEWSPAQHLFHLLLANELSLKNAAALAAGKGLLIRPFGRLADEAEDILARGRIERGRAQSPRFVRPRGSVDLGFVRDLVRSTQAQIESVPAEAAAAAPDCIPHQILGDLSASQWLRFARMHTAHHLLIIRDLLRAA